MESPNKPNRLRHLELLVRQIPPGRCASYGELGRALPNPVSGFLAGKWMARLESTEPEVPWWRVVKKDGTIALFDRDPALGLEQRKRLETENVPFNGDLIDMEAVKWNEFAPIE